MAPHVCIVGAGASGLRCATVLLEHSYKVTIIEARNRIGGRVRQSVLILPVTLCLSIIRSPKAMKWEA